MKESAWEAASRYVEPVSKGPESGKNANIPSTTWHYSAEFFRKSYAAFQALVDGYYSWGSE